MSERVRWRYTGAWDWRRVNRAMKALPPAAFFPLSRAARAGDDAARLAVADLLEEHGFGVEARLVRLHSRVEAPRPRKRRARR